MLMVAYYSLTRSLTKKCDPAWLSSSRIPIYSTHSCDNARLTFTRKNKAEGFQSKKTPAASSISTQGRMANRCDTFKQAIKDAAADAMIRARWKDEVQQNRNSLGGVEWKWVEMSGTVCSIPQTGPHTPQRTHNLLPTKTHDSKLPTWVGPTSLTRGEALWVPSQLRGPSHQSCIAAAGSFTKATISTTTLTSLNIS